MRRSTCSARPATSATRRRSSGTFFRTDSPQWGFDNPELRQALEDALRITDLDERTAAYEEINRTIMDFLPGRAVRPLDVEPGVPGQRRRDSSPAP